MFCQLRYFLVAKSSLEISNCDLVMVWKKTSREENELGTVVESVLPGLKNTWQRLPWSLNGDKKVPGPKMIYIFLNLN